MTRLNPKAWVRILASLVTVATVLFLVTTKRQKTTKTQFCDQCGMRQWTTVDDPVGAVSQSSGEHRLQDTNLSRWFKTHITPHCKHSWRFNHSSAYTYRSLAGQPLWKISKISGSAPAPFIIYFPDDERERVESLLRESPEKCRMYIHDRLQGKDEAGD